MVGILGIGQHNSPAMLLTVTFIENVDTSETFYRTIIQLVLKQILYHT